MGFKVWSDNMMDMQQKIIINAVIKKEQKVLLSSSYFDGQVKLTLPGGELLFGDDPKEFIFSLLKKEFGKAVSSIHLIDAVSDLANERLQYIHILFLVDINPNYPLNADVSAKGYSWHMLPQLQLKDVDAFTIRALNIKSISGVTDDELIENESNVDNKATILRSKVITVHTDGGSRGNPGPSAAAYVVIDDQGRIILSDGKYLGITTNNQAEYQAVKMALDKAAEIGARVVSFNIDSLLVVNQMLGIYQIKNRDLWPIYASIKELMKKFESVTFHHVRREFNREADLMVNKILDEH